MYWSWKIGSPSIQDVKSLVRLAEVDYCVIINLPLCWYRNVILHLALLETKPHMAIYKYISKRFLYYNTPRMEREEHI
jgi:hypothetical protein